jgi:GTP-binding protein Era
LAQPGAPAATRCGLIAIVGKPNVGKSTLLNALVGQKISITSRKAQTTRHRITGMHTRGQTQFVFVDTPGFQTRHANALNRSLNRRCGVPFRRGPDSVRRRGRAFQPGGRTVLSCWARVSRRCWSPTSWTRWRSGRHRALAAGPCSNAMLSPSSCRCRPRMPRTSDRLLGICEKYLPEQAWWYDADELTDRSERFLASELVREKLFRLTGDELPYTSTVVIDKFAEEPPARKGHKRLVRIAATIVVERDSHKAMVIGDKGERIKRIGMETRVELENWPTPRCSSSCGSRCVRAGPMTRRGCAASVYDYEPLRRAHSPCDPADVSGSRHDEPAYVLHRMTGASPA